MLWEELGLEEGPPANLFYFTHFGLFRCPKEEQRTIPYDAEEDEELYKTHHGEPLHYSCFAHVGDLRSKSTWKLPYREADGSIDEKRLGHAVNYLLSPGGYRGNLADDNPWGPSWISRMEISSSMLSSSVPEPAAGWPSPTLFC